MTIIVKATDTQRPVFLAKGIPDGIDVVFVRGGDPFPFDAAAYFDLCFEEEGAAFASITASPVFVNAVIATCSELPPNYVRVNAWNGFWERNLLELAARDTQAEAAKQVLDSLGWSYVMAPDVPGMIAARVVAMIVNEAYYGWGDGISSKEDIDTAMKLGTNYPSGPFEWAERTGLRRFASLLSELSHHDERYIPAPALLNELKPE